jgi:hypothetical protein
MKWKLTIKEKHINLMEVANMKLFTLTNEYAEVIKGDKLIKVPVEYIGNKPIITIDHQTYSISRL